MDDCWRCNHQLLILIRPRNLTLRSTLFVAILLVSFFITAAVLVLRATDRHRQPAHVLQTLLEALPLLEKNSNQQQQRNVLLTATAAAAAKEHQQQHQQQRPPRGSTSIILYWTKFFETSDFEVGLGSKPFAPCSISSGDCLTTTDRGLLNDSDAVIFHGRDLHVNDLPPPEWRRPHQMFVFFLLESPVHTDLGLLQQPVFRYYFNRTMTYRRDSDAVELHAYGRLRCIDPSSSAYSSSPYSCLEFPRPVANGSQVLAPYEKFNYPAAAAGVRGSSSIDTTNVTSAAISRQKNRTVAWFVSNCQSNSQRESLVRRLSQFIDVDIYGKCAINNGQHNHSCANRAECDRMLSRHYRFYLSFENSLCPDYVTEKLYRPLAHDTVPVVYGGADYSHYLPAGSYVDARDFESPEALADHLKKLMANDTLYSSYFDWKRHYVVDPAPLDGWCRLCRLLSQQQPGSNSSSKDSSSSIRAFAAYAIDDVASWWSGVVTNRTCSPPPKSLV